MKVTDEDFYNFNNSALPKQAKENTAKNIRKGLEYENALNTPHGKVLQKDLNDILIGELSKIVSFRHDSNRSVSENYDELMVHINAYKTAQVLKSRWENILKTKEDGLDRVKSVSEQVSKNH